jgi:hypothetical protein
MKTKGQPGFFVPLSLEEKSALYRLATHEKRDPHQQIAMIVRQELERLGYLKLQKAEVERS